LRPKIPKIIKKLQKISKSIQKRNSLEKKEGKACYRYRKEGEDRERMEYLQFIARATSHIPDKGQAHLGSCIRSVLEKTNGRRQERKNFHEGT